jgi:hypothetical protein
VRRPTDLSALTDAPENGLPRNVLGGIGSGLTWAGGAWPFPPTAACCGHKQLRAVDSAGAQDVAGLSGEAALLARAVPKTLFLDIVPPLVANGIATTQIPARIEGLAFGQDVVPGGSVRVWLRLPHPLLGWGQT